MSCLVEIYVDQIVNQNKLSLISLRLLQSLSESMMTKIYYNFREESRAYLPPTTMEFWYVTTLEKLAPGLRYCLQSEQPEREVLIKC